MQQLSKQMQTMEAETIQKNAASLKSQTSRINLLFSCILLSVFFVSANLAAQDVKTKTVNLGNGVTKSYSYYLDKSGNEVLHGKCSITQTPVKNNDYIKIEGSSSLTCNYKDGKLN